MRSARTPDGNVNERGALRYLTAGLSVRLDLFSLCYNQRFQQHSCSELVGVPLRVRSIAFFVSIFTLVLLSSCGGSSNGSRPSGLSNRIFISAPLAGGGLVYIIDGKRDQVSQKHPAITPVTDGGLMAMTPDKSKVAVLGSAVNAVSILDTQTESVSGVVGIASTTESMEPLADNATVVVAEPNAPVTGSYQNGVVQFLNLTNATVSATVPVAQARRVVVSHSGTKVLVFTDSYTVSLIDVSAKTATAITSASFDHPVNAVFSADDNTAYILSCGAECGGTAANVSALTVSSGAVGAPTPVSGATVGLLDTSNRLYVAGSTSTGGVLDILDPSSLTVTTAAIAIGDGYHNAMAITSMGQLFIGAKNCVQCMSILNTSTSKAYINPCVSGTVTCPSGTVTGMEPLDNRPLIYVMQGGILHIYDLHFDPPQENLTLGVPFLALQGGAVDVKQVD